MRCPAKLNLCLHVLGKRPDGYHELRGIMVPIPWFDDLEVEVVPGGQGIVLDLASGSEAVPSGRENLAVRAAEAFLGAIGKSYAVRIRLAKNIPVGAGLGGGSSDAAGVLRRMNEVTGSPLDRAAIVEMAASLGADCPFFLDPRPVRMRERGDVVELLHDFPSLPVVVMVPAERLSTAEVFGKSGNLGLTWERRNGKDSCLLDQVQGPLTGTAWAELGVNDLSEAVFEECPRTRHWVDALARAGARASGVTGTGSAAFGVFDTLDAARATLEALQGLMRQGERAMAMASGLDS